LPKSHDTKTSKVSKKDNSHYFYPKNFYHAFLPKPDSYRYRNNSKKKFEKSQINIGQKSNKEREKSTNSIKMIMERAQTISAAKMKRAKSYL
jgi:hypothetical protein